MSVTSASATLPTVNSLTSSLRLQTTPSSSSLDVRATAAVQPEDIVSLSARALQQIEADQKRTDMHTGVIIPDASATDAQKAAFQKVLGSYEKAQQRVDATPFDPKYQANVDIINNPEATDAQKLDAYMNFKADSAFRHGQTHLALGMDDTDFKFDWLTRGSDFLVRAHANDGALSVYDQQTTAAGKRSPSQAISLDQNTANQIDITSKSSMVQQGVLTVDRFYDKLAAGLASWDLNKALADPRDQNTNRTPGFTPSVAYASDPKTVIAQTVSSMLNALSLSRVGNSPDPGAKAFVQLFTSITTEFEKRATERAQAPAVT